MYSINYSSLNLKKNLYFISILNIYHYIKQSCYYNNIYFSFNEIKKKIYHKDKFLKIYNIL